MNLSREGLDEYFTRINYSGPREPTLAVLRDLQYRHVLGVTFENLDVLLGRRIRLEPEALIEKLVHARRGGYCFEQNGLFGYVLAALGFVVTPLAARTRYGIPDDVATGRTHLLLKVDLPEGAYIADVGFGGLNPTAPFVLAYDVEQTTQLETYRFVRWGEGYELQARLGVVWTILYRFTLEPQTAPDQEISNWWVSTSPQSRFVQSLILARPRADRRVNLLNNRLTVRHRDGVVEERFLTGSDDLAEALQQHFDLDLTMIAGRDGAKAIVERCFPAAKNRIL